METILAGVRYDEMIPVLIDGIQRLKEKLDECHKGRETIQDIMEVHNEHEQLFEADKAINETDAQLEAEYDVMLLAIEEEETKMREYESRIAQLEAFFDSASKAASSKFSS